MKLNCILSILCSIKSLYSIQVIFHKLVPNLKKYHTVLNHVFYFQSDDILLHYWFKDYQNTIYRIELLHVILYHIKLKYIISCYGKLYQLYYIISTHV